MDPATVRRQAADLPTDPGVYQFLEGETVLYVGKALDLRDRVRSYADPRSRRVSRMVRRADDIEVAVTKTETQALLLEANLIKRLAPRYNVRLRDDKSYPLVQLTDHEFPRIEVTRDPGATATVYGPFTDRGRLDTVVKALRDLYGLRGCSDHKFANRDRPCLDYDLGLCIAPCTGECSDAEYRVGVEAAKRFFAGETGIVTEPLQSAMERAAQSGEFERAATLRDRLRAAEQFHVDAGAPVAGGDEDGRVVDVLGVAVEGTEATVARLRSEGGKLVERDRHVLAGEATTAGAALAAFIPQFYAERRFPDELLLSDQPTESEEEVTDAGLDIHDWLDTAGVEVRVPGTGRGARLVDLALKNARRRDPDVDELSMLGEALYIEYPHRIEGFDVSHTGGRSTVGSDVTFVDGSPEKGAYRRKKLDDGVDDSESIHNLISWRAHRAIAGRDDRPDPDLIVVDGGPSQWQAAQDALSAVQWDVPVVAIAKGEDRHDAATDTVYGAEGPFDWPQDSPQLRVLQRVRDEAHRFAVQYHEILRDDVSTILDELPGVGPARRRRLLRRFGSVDGIREASVDELQTVPGIGETTASTIAARL